MDFRASVRVAVCILVLIICQSSIVASAESNDSEGRRQLLNLPLFRAPTQQEIDASSVPILWSAHETGDTLRMLPDDEALIMCLLDRAGGNLTVPLHSLIWTLESSDSGYRSHYRLRRDNSHFDVTVDGLWVRGEFNEAIGSLLHIYPRSMMQMRMKIRCEYQLAGQSTTIRSTWLILWDESSEAIRIRKAFLLCDRTAYHRIGEARNQPLAVAYNCSGLEDTSLMESAALSVYSGHEKTKKGRKVVVKLTELFSNCTTGDFFGFAFGGRVQFGWTVGTSNTSARGATLERSLAEPGNRLGLSLSTKLPSGRLFTSNYWLKTVANRRSANVSLENSLLMPSVDGSGWTQIHLDELLDSAAHRTLPCPFLCLQDSRSVCQHRWIGPGGAVPPQAAPATQPNSLHLKSSDLQSAGMWTCAVQRSMRAESITYAVSVKQRPFVCGPRIPRHSVVFPPDHFSINCSLCGFSVNAKLEFGVYSAIGAAAYSEERTKLRNTDGSVLLGLKFFDISPTSDGTTFILHCQGVEPDGRAGGNFVTVHLLPLPIAKPLNVCHANEKPCRFDCRSSVAHRLQSIGVSVGYIFSLYSMSGQLYMVVNESSGVLEDARKVAGAARNGALKAECQEFFYYKEDREGQSAKLEPQQIEDRYGQPFGERRKLILVLHHKSKENQQSETVKDDSAHSEPAWRKRGIFGIISAVILVLILTVFCIITGKIIRKNRRHLMDKVDSNNKAPENGGMGAGKRQQQGISAGERQQHAARPLREETGVGESMNATLRKKIPLYPRISQFFQMATNSQQVTPNPQKMPSGNYQVPRDPNYMQQNPSQMPPTPNQMSLSPNQMPVGQNQMPIGPNQMQHSLNLMQQTPSSEDQQGNSSQSLNFNAVQSGLEADIDMTSQSRSVELSVKYDLENQVESSFVLDRGSTDSESESQSKEPETGSPRLANQHSCGNFLSFLHGRSASADKSVEPEDDNTCKQHPSEAVRSRGQSPAPPRSGGQSPASPRSRGQLPVSPGSNGQSPETSGTGFEFCLNQDSELFSSESQL